MAVAKGHLRVIKFLLEQKHVDINVRDAKSTKAHTQAHARIDEKASEESKKERVETHRLATPPAEVQGDRGQGPIFSK